jgi:hypothetical protein
LSTNHLGGRWPSLLAAFTESYGHNHGYWPELQVGDIEKAMSSVTLFYWGTKEEVGKRWHQKQLELTDEEAESIGV